MEKKADFWSKIQVLSKLLWSMNLSLSLSLNYSNSIEAFYTSLFRPPLFHGFIKLFAV